MRRETVAEAGVRVGAVAYALSQPRPFPSSLMLGCVGEALGGTLAVDRAAAVATRSNYNLQARS